MDFNEQPHGEAPIHVGTMHSRTGWAYIVSETQWRDGQFWAVRTVAQRGEFASCNAAEIAGLHAAQMHAEHARIVQK